MYLNVGNKSGLGKNTMKESMLKFINTRVKVEAEKQGLDLDNLK